MSLYLFIPFFVMTTDFTSHLLLWCKFCALDVTHVQSYSAWRLWTGLDFPHITRYCKRHTEIKNRCWRYRIYCTSFFFTFSQNCFLSIYFLIMLPFSLIGSGKCVHTGLYKCACRWLKSDITWQTPVYPIWPNYIYMCVCIWGGWGGGDG